MHGYITPGTPRIGDITVSSSNSRWPVARMSPRVDLARGSSKKLAARDSETGARNQRPMVQLGNDDDRSRMGRILPDRFQRHWADRHGRNGPPGVALEHHFAAEGLFRQVGMFVMASSM